MSDGEIQNPLDQLPFGPGCRVGALSQIILQNGVFALLQGVSHHIESVVRLAQVSGWTRRGDRGTTLPAAGENRTCQWIQDDFGIHLEELGVFANRALVRRRLSLKHFTEGQDVDTDRLGRGHQWI